MSVCRACSTPQSTVDLLECCRAWLLSNIVQCQGNAQCQPASVVWDASKRTSRELQRAVHSCFIEQVAAAEQQSLQWEAYASGTANAVRWHDASKDVARGDAFGTALAGNAVLRPQVTRVAAAGAGTGGASMFDGTFTGSVIITGRHILMPLPFSCQDIQGKFS
jgi:hypothetical protein